MYSEEVVEVPVVGEVPAGLPDAARRANPGLFAPAAELGRGGLHLPLGKGDSMEDVGIHDGDYVLVQLPAHGGERPNGHRPGGRYVTGNTGDLE